VAQAAGAPFDGLWLDAPAEVLRARVRDRRGDASDADVAVLEAQLARDEGPLAWTRLAASAPAEEIARDGRARLSL
jgi:predicted kinase